MPQRACPAHLRRGGAPDRGPLLRCCGGRDMAAAVGRQNVRDGTPPHAASPSPSPCEREAVSARRGGCPHTCGQWILDRLPISAEPARRPEAYLTIRLIRPRPGRPAGAGGGHEPRSWLPAPGRAAPGPAARYPDGRGAGTRRLDIDRHDRWWALNEYEIHHPRRPQSDLAEVRAASQESAGAEEQRARRAPPRAWACDVRMDQDPHLDRRLLAVCQCQSARHAAISITAPCGC